MQKYLLLILISVCLIIPANAQEDKKDTVETHDDWDEWEDSDEKWSDDINIDIFDFKGAPTVAVNYGLGKLDHKQIHGSFADPRGIELKLGYTDNDEVWQSSHIIKTSFKNIYAANITTDLSALETSDEGYRTNTWKFGLGRTSGYGYKFGPSALFFTSGSTLDWTRLKFYGYPTDSGDVKTADYFNNSFRFGNSFEAGIRLQLIRQISLEADYQRSIIFPRHLFWKWLGSAVIENAGQFMIDEFVDEILDSSPYFAPVISFMLKNGLNYGLYELRKDKMNWPFNSAPPLTYDQFKFGVTFVL